VYFISKLPIEIDPIEWVIVVTAALLISFIATIYPSMQATKQKPVEILRYE
jgi:lipoprotein-releasing system permease protein